MICPKCKKTVVQRVHRSWWERLVPGWRRYYCAPCNHVFRVIL